MELFDELLLSVLSILLALLIGKFAGAAAAGDVGRRFSRESVDRSEIGQKIKIGEEFGPVERVLGSQVQNDEGTVATKATTTTTTVGDDFLVKRELDRKGEADASIKERVSSKELVNEEVFELEKEEEEEEEESTVIEIGKGEEKIGIDGKKESSLLHGEDEWEGIEHSELEKIFLLATQYVSSDDGANALLKLSSDVRKQLYGLHKVANEGPCYEPQPMALKVSARARWHAWQSLGNMNPDVAMEQYIFLLSESIPVWMGRNHEEVAKHDKDIDFPDRGIPQSCNPKINSFSRGQPSSETHRVLDDPSCNEIESASTASKVLQQGLTNTFIMDLISPARVSFLIFCC